MEKDNINISMKDLYPHPDNPRKDLGDLEELSKSIKANGIMQNLTVIPGHKNQDGRWVEDGYTLIIGHRRHAAAKAAGLTELPCRIVKGLSYREQVAIMLEENMQRNDLTIYEQAQGFQMMLDLGETEDSIAEKTGFSKTTIKRRLNIAKLDQKLIKEKEKDDCFQLSLTDLYALEKIEDIETRNKVLKDASNHQQLIWKVENAVTEAKRKKVEAAIIEKLKAIGVKKAPKKAESEMYASKWDRVKEFSLDKEVPEKINLKGKELYYLRYYNSIYVIKKHVKKKEVLSEYEIKRKQIEANKKAIGAKAKEAADQMKVFVRKLATDKLYMKEQTWHKEAVWDMMLKNEVLVSNNRVIGFLLDKNSWDVSKEDKEAAKETISKMEMLQQMLCALAYNIPTDLADYNGYYIQDRGGRIKEIYDFLTGFGFTFDSDEYEQILDGSSELYEVKEEVKND